MRSRTWSGAACLCVGLALLCMAAGTTWAQQPPVAPPGGGTQVAPPSQVRWDLAFAVAISVGLPCLAAGYAVGKVGAAALGAAAERPELLARSLILVALGEGIAVFGAVVAMLVLFLKF